jgi:FAD synthetase
MTQDAGRQHQDAKLNGVTKPDAALERTLPDICYELQAKIDAFLSETTDDEVLRNVQAQVRTSMKVIWEALRRYG